MGRTKQVLPVRGEPAVSRCCRSILEGGMGEVVVVLGHDHERVRQAVGNLPVRFARNEDPDSDMTSSVRVGLDALPPEITGVAVTLCDHPLVEPETYGAVRKLHHTLPACIIIPVYDGRGGHPTLFPRETLESLGNGRTLRDIVRGNGTCTFRVAVDDPGIVMDMDTETDYRRLAQLAEAAP